MAYITTIPPEAAEGELKALYTELSRSRGKIANILQVHSLRPSALRAHMTLYMDLMFAPGGLSRRERELIAVVVSRANECGYCIAHHAEALARYVSDPTLLEAVSRGDDAAGLTDRERALSNYARGLTLRPGAATRDDVDALRAEGLDDSEILLANLIVAYFNFVNRIALGLGTETSNEEVSGYDV
jgi:uncharacterized peroxidase-related enzyme